MTQDNKIKTPLWKKVLGTLAPTLGLMAGGPLGPAAGRLASQVLLGKDDASDDELDQAVSAISSEQMIRLREIDEEQKRHFADLGVKLEELASTDRDSARKREMALPADHTPKLLAGLIVCGYVGVQYFLLTEVVDASMRELVIRSLTIIEAALLAVLNYYFGSSAGSAVKNLMLANREADKR